MTKKIETEVTEQTFDAVAKQFIKYNGEHLEIGDKFKVKKSDVEELNKYAEIEIIEEIPHVDGQEGEKDGE